MQDNRKYRNSGEGEHAGPSGENDRFHPEKTLPCHIYEELAAFAEELEKKADRKIGELEKRVETLQRKLEEVQREKADLELMFEMSTEHSDGITDELLKKVESTMKESEYRFRLISNTIPLPIVVSLRREDKIIYANQPSKAIFGASHKELKKRNLSEFYELNDWIRLQKVLAESNYADGFELKGQRLNGDTFHAIVFVQPLIFDERDCLLTVFYDTTERKRFEEERMRLAAAVEQASEIIIIADRRGDIVYVNPAFEKTMGYSAGEIVGLHFRIFKSDRHDEIFYRRMWTKISNGRVWSGHIINRKKNGVLCEFETTISPIRDKDGNIINYVSVNRDVTQEVKMEQQIRQAQKMEAIGTLAGGIAHDFNNILASILGFTQLASLNIENTQAARKNLQNVLTGVDRAKGLIRQILTFSRQTEQKKKPIELGPLIKEVVKLLRATIPKTIHIHKRIETGALIVGDSTQIHQMIMNLCINATQAMMEQGGTLTIKLDQIDGVPGDVAGEKNIRLTVTDSGVGIEQDIQERIFDPFFTTKPPGEGTGMGLAVVHGIVESHKGTIVCDSHPGKGTKFEVYLPCLAEEDDIVEIEFDEYDVAGDERILLIDDEKDITLAYRELLSQLGYEVEPFTDGEKALNHFLENPSAFDVIIMDQTMPGLTGKTFIKKIREVKENIPFIICTGTTEGINRKVAESLGVSDYLQKPVSFRQLAASIRKIFDSREK